MNTSLQTYKIANFALNSNYIDLPKETVDQLKRHLLDSIGSMIHAVAKPSIQKLFKQIKFLADGGNCNVPGAGKVAVDRAAQIFTALIRYPDFMDNFLGKEATCHPSDNIGGLLAAMQITKATGKDFLTAMAVGYEIECRLVEEIPVMMKGFDHTVLLAYSLTASLSKVFALSAEQAANALSIAGCSINPLVTCRASYTYEWKGFASSLVALNCMQTVLLAKQNMTGPLDIFDREKKGFEEIFGMKLKYDWKKDKFGLIRKCILKKYNSEVHTQTAIEAALDLQKLYKFSAADIKEINVTTFLTAYHIVGGGEYGDRTKVSSKEQADHSLFYLIAVALLDGDIYPDQFLPKRILKDDVQKLLKKIKVHTSFPLHEPKKVAGVLDKYTAAYPKWMYSKVEITLKNNDKFKLERKDYPGFFTRPFTWKDTTEKFKRLTNNIIASSLQEKIIDVIKDLENRKMKELYSLLNKIQ
jgi:Uncharacterized protein involved in propionate catabolism